MTKLILLDEEYWYLPLSDLICLFQLNTKQYGLFKYFNTN
jgi:hypothetical protein